MNEDRIRLRFLHVATIVFAVVTFHVPVTAAAAAAAPPWGVDEHDFAVLSAGPLTGKGRVAQQEAALERAAQAGDADAAALLGIARLYGLEVVKNEASAAHWIQRAAEAGHPRGMASWSALLIDGLAGVKPDPAAGRTWASRAADRGNAFGMINLASALERGLGGPGNVAESLQWTRRAADLGSGAAMALLGVRYEQGRSSWGAGDTGVPRNEAEATKWYQRGAAAGEEIAKSNLALLERRRAIPGKLTQELIVAPYNVAERAGYCEDALRTLGSLFGGARKPTEEEQAALRDWRGMKSDAMKFAALYGLVSFIGIHAQSASVSVEGRVHVPEATLSACESDRLFLVAHFGYVMRVTYVRQWQAANRKNRARRTLFQMARQDAGLLTGWCLATIAEAESSLGTRPALFGYDPRNAAGAMQIERTTSRLRSAATYWRNAEASLADGVERISVGLGRSAQLSTRTLLLGSEPNVQWQNVILANWLATEADLCVRIPTPKDEGVAMPLLAAASEASASG